MNWLKFKWADLKLRWQLARHGEVMILNAIDAIDGALICLDFPADLPVTRTHLRMAAFQLKQLISYEDEPEMVYPDEHEADRISGCTFVFPRDST